MRKRYLLKLFILIVSILSFAIQGSGQVSKAAKKQIQKLLKRADRYYAEEDYHKAFLHYLQVLEADPANERAIYQAGINALLIYGNSKSLDFLLKYGASTMPASQDKHYNYWLGRAYHANAQFEKAEKSYKKYASQLPKSDSRQEEVQRLMMQAQYGKALAEHAVDYYAFSLGSPLNSRYSDHSPMLTNNRQTLIFTSRRTEDKQGEEITPKGDAFENIYISHLVNGTWQKPKLMGKGFNTRKQHTSNVQLFDNDTKMLVYKSVNFGSLFISEKKNGKWTSPRKFSKYTSSGQFIPNGFVTKDGKSVYFASSQGSRNGNLDLFVSKLTADSSWSEPERLPAVINSDADEDAPFVSTDGQTLYFSSRGHTSMGGYDVFKTTYDNATRQWNKPVNLGYPINSPGDDIYFIPDSLNKEYFVASGREGTVGQEDIFVVRLFGELLVKGTVKDDKSGEALPGYTISFTSAKNPERHAAAVSGSGGNFNFRLRSNYVYQVEISNPEGKVVLVEEIKLPLAYNDSTEFIQDFRINFPAAPVAQLQGLQVENLNLIKLNYLPSDSLIITGVVRDGASVISGAQVQLRMENSNEVIASANADTEGRYTFTLVPERAIDYVLEITKPGYLLNSIAILYIDQPGLRRNNMEAPATENALEIHTRLTPIEVGAEQVLGGIYFDFNKSILFPESRIALNKLYTFLQENPSIRLQISGHTDNINTPAINNLIAQKRAQAVADYLIAKGIKRSRLVTKGYGQAQPVASNDYAVNGQDVNRRVEVKILDK